VKIGRELSVEGEKGFEIFFYIIQHTMVSPSRTHLLVFYYLLLEVGSCVQNFLCWKKWCKRVEEKIGSWWKLVL